MLYRLYRALYRAKSLSLLVYRCTARFSLARACARVRSNLHCHAATSLHETKSTRYRRYTSNHNHLARYRQRYARYRCIGVAL